MPNTDEEITVKLHPAVPRIFQGIRRNVYLACRHGPTATKGIVMRRRIVGRSTTVVLWGGVAGVMGAGTAQAEPKAPVPLGSWPGCPEDNPSGPCRWCPGDPRCRPAIFVRTQWFGTRMSATPIGTSISGRAMSPRTFSRETRHLRLHLLRPATVSRACRGASDLVDVCGTGTVARCRRSQAGPDCWDR
jgi:hypothetical protein